MPINKAHSHFFFHLCVSLCLSAYGINKKRATTEIPKINRTTMVILQCKYTISLSQILGFSWIYHRQSPQIAKLCVCVCARGAQQLCIIFSFCWMLVRTKFIIPNDTNQQVTDCKKKKQVEKAAHFFYCSHPATPSGNEEFAFIWTTASNKTHKQNDRKESTRANNKDSSNICVWKCWVEKKKIWQWHKQMNVQRKMTISHQEPHQATSILSQSGRERNKR